MRKVYAKYNWEDFLFSGIDWAGLVKSDLSVDGLSHFTLTPSEHWAHTHTHTHLHTLIRRAYHIIDRSESGVQLRRAQRR